MKLSVCIATYRRNERLAALLDDLVRQYHLPDEVIVVDNEPSGGARGVVAHRCAMGVPFPIHYAIQPEKNISLTRNRTVAVAQGEWLAFVDDDERAPQDWLAQLVETAQRCRADGVLGPVEPVVPEDAPGWIRRGGFYRWARMRTGTPVPRHQLRFGNVLLRAAPLRATPTPFDPAYGLTGGEDGDLLARLVQHGAAIVWCDEAVVHEPVEPARLSLRWLTLRALRGGQDFARHCLAGRHGELSAGGRALLLARAVAQALAAAVLALLAWPFGLHHAASWLLKAAANVGKVSLFLGWHYREYGAKPA